jgi:hypothetical protein
MSIRIRLNDKDQTLLEETLCRAVSVTQTEAMLTHPALPERDALEGRTDRLRALLVRVREA